EKFRGLHGCVGIASPYLYRIKRPFGELSSGEMTEGKEEGIDMPAQNDKGFTLAEVLAAMTTLGTGIVNLLYGSGYSLLAKHKSSTLTEAHQIAEGQLHKVREHVLRTGEWPDNLNPSVSDYSVTIQFMPVTGLDVNPPAYNETTFLSDHYS